MGFRNPFRIDLDENDVAYVTDYSPDSRVPENFRGPAGAGRSRSCDKPSSYGWPLCYSAELPYYRWDYVSAGRSTRPPQTFDVRQPSPRARTTRPSGTRGGRGHRRSPTRTSGTRSTTTTHRTPLGTPCFAYYNGSGTTQCPQLFPEFGPGGGVGPHGASPYDFDQKSSAPGKFPEYYDGSFIFGEFTRDYLREIRLDSKGEVFKIYNVLNCSGVNVPPQPPTVPTPERPFDCDSPMDMKFGPDGNFYLLTYGDGFFQANADAQLVKFSYIKDDEAQRDRTGGAARAAPRRGSSAAAGRDRSGRVLTTSAARRPAAARRRDRERHVLEPAHRVRVGRADDPHAGAQRVADVLAAQVEPVGQAVDLERDALLERDLEHALEVERVLRPAVDEPARRMAEAAHVRVAQRLLDALRHLPPRHPLPAVHARLHPVELGEHVVGEVEPPVGEDVALDPAQDAERRQHLVRGRDLLGLAADVVRR